MADISGRCFGLGAYVSGTRKAGTTPIKFGLAAYTSAMTQADASRIPTLWTKKNRRRA
jgi:hypothetical protein